MSKRLLTVLGGARPPYIRTLQKLFGTSIVSYLPLDETSGTDALDSSGNGYNGVYTNGVTLAPATFDGTDDYIKWYTAEFRTAFVENEGAFIIWVKIPADVWAEAANRYIIRFYSGDGDLIYLSKVNVVNGLQFKYTAGGTAKTITNYDKGGNLNWMMLALSWSKTNDQLIAYADGYQLGTTQTSLGTWTGSALPASSGMNIGAYLTSNLSYNFKGSLAHATYLSRAITPAEALKVYRANPTMAAA